MEINEGLPTTIEEESELDEELDGYRNGYIEGYGDGVLDGREQGKEAALFSIRMAFKDNYDPDVRDIIQQLTTYE